MLRLKTVRELSWKALESWSSDNVPRLGASLAYYTLFSFAPILIVAIGIGGLAFGADAVRGQIVTQLDGLIGVEGARAVQSMLEGASKPGTSILAIVLGTVTFIIAATGAFLELQHALNTIFRVKADPTKSTISEFIKNRARSFGIVLVIGFLLLVSLTINAALAAGSAWIGKHARGGAWFWTSTNILVSLGVVIVLFALIYRFLPDVRLAWRDIWLGASLTALLFIAGKEVIGNYLGHSDWTSSYGGAGSVLVLLLWIYYSAQIVLFGAELTRECAEHRRGAPPPSEFARRDPAAHPSAKHPAPGKHGHRARLR